jgi:hypothetical protein
MKKYVCQHRKVSDEGRIICSKIALGDNQVSPNLCRDCPAKACNCDHLRFSLQKPSLSPIVVRWGNGHTEVWDDQPPALSFLHSACSLKALPISSPRDCMGCALREGCLPQEEIQSVPQEVVVVAQALRPGSGQAQDNVIPFVKVGT